MCLAVYVASDVPLPESSKHAPAFYLESVPLSEKVRRQFRLAHVYYAGSHEGCGCGFSKDGRDSQELEQCQQNYRSLAEVLSPVVREGAQVQLFTCWEGDQSTNPETTDIITVEQLVEPKFELQQLSLLTIQRKP
ncbi:MAG: hypothetical protein LBE62_15855 [Azonexus sp.]|jgi:hypothetical protein|nr:hypothetical protein [Azonexus sp.]